MKFLGISLLLLSLGSVNVLAADEKAADSAYQQMNEKVQTMAKDMDSMTPKNNPDMDFVQTMIRHHQGAIELAQVELNLGKDPQAKKMAQKMIQDQKKEIAKLNAWQEKQAG